ncbi:DUF6296 family protein [Actinacidiphila sp. ITFR-21]|uniref:DUF6296 family protein n=1 Tax=Actinacidiphila sp. ITFR-21 TaxID=3075199 RepID=UPI00288A9630|nr:DUF6296 family protein [Streptomyces sp. ITFR-21]WNI14151.1 DUF6296 family protein [Streptomyces sp. ITFR-21]
MEYPETYELLFEEPAAGHDRVTVHRTQQSGASGAPIYEDETGIVRAEINAEGEIRMVASGGQQAPAVPRVIRPPTS